MHKPGDVFERYTIEALLGEGGMGTVYRARDGRLDRRVALKLVREHDSDPEKSAERRARLMREAKAAAAFSHPNAVGIFDVGEVDGTAFIAMEVISGRTLREAMADPKVPLRERVRWLTDIARALDAAHKAGIVHRDIKPENVMITDDSAVKVLDFGIARRQSVAVDGSSPTEVHGAGTLTADGVQLGTPLYMAPEQIHGRALDGRSDQFSWGVVAYEVLTGQVPWSPRGDTLALVGAILTEEPLPLEGAPSAVDRVVRRALAKAPADRFATMGELVKSLETSVESAPPFAHMAPLAQPATIDRRKYSEAEIEQILERALEQEAPDDRLSLRELREAAREIGIADSSLEAAAREVERRRHDAGDDEDPAEKRRRRMRSFLRHAATYAVICGFMVMMFGWGWTRWMCFGWGIGVAMHGVEVVLPKEPRKRKKRREKKASPAVEEGASRVLETARLRVRALPGRDDVRVRIAPRPEEVPEALDEEEARRRTRRSR